jgi:transposase
MKIQTRKEMVRQLLTTDYSNHHIARNINVAPNTVRRHKLILSRILLDWQQVKQMHDELFEALFSQKKQADKHKRLPDWGLVHKQMQAHKHQTLVQLWEEYCSIEPSSAYSQSQFNFYYNQHLKSVGLSMRQTHYAGECVYVDYAGKTIPWINSETGEQCFAQVFVGVLGCSQYTFAFASKSQKLEDFIEAHNQMFQFFGGVPQVIVPDNLKSAVTTPGKFAVINRTYLEQSRHYNCVIEPARVRQPQDKSLAEIGVLLVTRWITVVLRRRHFFSIHEINQAIMELLPKLNQRNFKRLEGCRQSRFEEMDKPKLQFLPNKPFEFAQWITAQKVNTDYHVQILGHFYSVPHQYRNKKVEARVTLNMVELLHNGQRVASHIRSELVGGSTTDTLHMPDSHRAYAEQNSDHYTSWAEAIGEHAVRLVEGQFKGKPGYSMEANKACSQLQSLARLYGNQRFEAACQCAVDIASLTVKSVRSILQCKIDTRGEVTPRQTQLPLHHNVRGAEYYQGGL